MNIYVDGRRNKYWWKKEKRKKRKNLAENAVVQLFCTISSKKKGVNVLFILLTDNFIKRKLDMVNEIIRNGSK